MGRRPAGRHAPEEILRTHPHAAPFWDGLLRGALHGDDRTAGNTTTTVQQAMALFFQADDPPPLHPRPGPAGHRPRRPDRSAAAPSTCSGRDDPTPPPSPLMTAIAEHVLDTALQLATASPHGRLCPLVPGLPRRAALDRAAADAAHPDGQRTGPGLSFIYAAQTWRQLVICYGEDEARAMFGLTNDIVVFGGGKDGDFYQELSDLIGTTRVSPHLLQPRPRAGPAAPPTARTTRSCGRRRSGCCRRGTRWCSQRTRSPSSPG